LRKTSTVQENNSNSETKKNPEDVNSCRLKEEMITAARAVQIALNLRSSNMGQYNYAGKFYFLIYRTEDISVIFGNVRNSAAVC